METTLKINGEDVGMYVVGHGRGDDIFVGVTKSKQRYLTYGIELTTEQKDAFNANLDMFIRGVDKQRPYFESGELIGIYLRTFNDD